VLRGGAKYALNISHSVINLIKLAKMKMTNSVIKIRNQNQKVWLSLSLSRTPNNRDKFNQ